LIDYQDVEDFIAHLFGQTDTNGTSTLSPKSVRDAVSVLSQENPAADHHIRVPRQSGQILSLEELLEMVALTGCAAR